MRTTLIRRLIESIRNVPRAILRLFRAVLLPLALRVAGVVSKRLHLLTNTLVSLTSSHVVCDASQRGGCSTVATSLAPRSSTELLPSGLRDDPPNGSRPSMTTSSAAYAPDILFSARRVTSVTTLNPIPIAPEEFERYLRRKPMCVCLLLSFLPVVEKPFVCEERKSPTKKVLAPGRSTTQSACIDTAIVIPLAKGFTYRRAPDMWEQTVHPEGACYFFNPTKV